VAVAGDGASRGAQSGQAGRGAPNAGQGGANGGQGGANGRQGGFNGPPPSAAACDSVNKALAAHPKQRARLDSLMAQMRSGAVDFQTARETMRALYDSMGVDPRAARGCRGNGQGGGNGGNGGGQGGAGGFCGAGGAGGFGAGGMGRGRAAQSRGIVFVQNGASYEPRLVQLGLSNFDVVEIVSGLREGERVALVSGAVQQQNRTNMQNRMRSNSGLPGMGGGPGGGGGGPRGGGGGGGGPRGG